MANEQSVVEVFSNSTNAWFVGLVMKSQDDVLLVNFLDLEGGVRQKVSSRLDPAFAALGTNLTFQPPPGFMKVPSNTRPGQHSFFDPVGKRKVGTVPLAWKAYLTQRFVEAGVDTMSVGTPVSQPVSPTITEVMPASQPQSPALPEVQPALPEAPRPRTRSEFQAEMGRCGEDYLHVPRQPVPVSAPMDGGLLPGPAALRDGGYSGPAADVSRQTPESGLLSGPAALLPAAGYAPAQQPDTWISSQGSRSPAFEAANPPAASRFAASSVAARIQEAVEARALASEAEAAAARATALAQPPVPPAGPWQQAVISPTLGDLPEVAPVMSRSAGTAGAIEAAMAMSRNPNNGKGAIAAAEAFAAAAEAVAQATAETRRAAERDSAAADAAYAAESRRAAVRDAAAADAAHAAESRRAAERDAAAADAAYAAERQRAAERDAAAADAAYAAERQRAAVRDAAAAEAANAAENRRAAERDAAYAAESRRVAERDAAAADAANAVEVARAQAAAESRRVAARDAAAADAANAAEVAAAASRRSLRLAAAETAAAARTAPKSVVARSSVEDWVAHYTHMPLRTTPGLMYFNRIPVNYTKFVELMMPVAYVNQEQRERVIEVVESGAVMTTSLDMFTRSNVDDDGNLHWKDGGMRDFVTWVFHHHNVGAPTEDLIQPLFELFDLDKSGKLGVWESICLVDALMRATFMKEFVMPEQPEEEEDET